jgi:type IX secretion system PorP/SprF family membrane protein
MDNKRYMRLAAVVLLAALGQGAKAQLNPLGSQYYNNQYLVNPAFAGEGQGLKVNAAYRRLWSGIPGSPLTQNVTVDYGMGKVGLGLNVNNESSGLLRQTRAVASYAYHLPLDSGRNHLSFGLSLGVMSQRVQQEDINGNPNDITVGEYNGQRTYLDGDFGAAFVSGGLTVQASIPNLKSFFKKDVVKLADMVTFFSAVGYAFRLQDGMELEPKVAYRGVRGFDNMVDVGAQFSLSQKRFLVMGMYHSNQSATFGLGMDIAKRYLVSGMYTTQTSQLSGYTNGSFELNLRVNLTR